MLDVLLSSYDGAARRASVTTLVSVCRPAARKIATTLPSWRASVASADMVCPSFSVFLFLLLTQMLSVQVRVHRCYPSHCKGSCQTPQRNTSSTMVLWPHPPAARLWSGSSSRTWQPFPMNRWAKLEAPVELNWAYNKKGKVKYPWYPFSFSPPESPTTLW